MEHNAYMRKASHVDYNANLLFNAIKVVDVKYSLLLRKMKSNGAIVPVIHVDGVQTSTGQIIDFELWPRRNATKSDLEALEGAKVSNITYRVGYHEDYNEDGDKTVVEGKPKWLSLEVNGQVITLSGDVHQYEDDWENADEEDESVNPVEGEGESTEA